ncbi:conserved protein of unknown function [Georgfuchsia toluolica]|uniref:V-type ATP synthase subunit D n=1 Tax=Georgfuchsia toluolica TaxID=424218 RepID=A0A916NH95_9PROT|nr:V-type ATP synthase subunit D [Georgfuchsia toluolica]CAG4883076.1 conserved protein of unknown function [Georgfuchsia toluolica]
MSDITPTRSVVIALAEERRAMQEGYVFLDEKCLLLAGAMMRELRLFDAASARLHVLQAQARRALAAAVRHHGLHGLQVYPALPQGAIALNLHQHLLLNVPLLDASTKCEPVTLPEPAFVSPEAEDCRAAFVALTQHLMTMAAMSGNLARLHRDYRRSVRRVRALQDVQLPELDDTMNEVETQLEDLERDELLGARWQRRA